MKLRQMGYIDALISSTQLAHRAGVYRPYHLDKAPSQIKLNNYGLDHTYDSTIPSSFTLQMSSFPQNTLKKHNKSLKTQKFNCTETTNPDQYRLIVSSEL